MVSSSPSSLLLALRGFVVTALFLPLLGCSLPGQGSRRLVGEYKLIRTWAIVDGATASKVKASGTPVDGATVSKVKVSGTPVPSPSESLAMWRCGEPATLRTLRECMDTQESCRMGDWRGWAPGNFHFADAMCLDDQRSKVDASIDTLHLRLSLGGGGAYSAVASETGLGVRFNYGLSAHARRVGGAGDGASMSSRIAFEGEVSPGEVLVFLGRVGTVGETDFHAMAIWRPVHWSSGVARGSLPWTPGSRVFGRADCRAENPLLALGRTNCCAENPFSALGRTEKGFSVQVIPVHSGSWF